MKQHQAKYAIFLSKANRDEYLGKLVANGFRVKRTVVWGRHIVVRYVGDALGGGLTPEQMDGVFYTVKDVDRRKGK